MDDRLLNTLVLDALEGRGSARAAWEAIAFCIEKALPFPEWVMDYLAATAKGIEDHLVNRDQRHPLRLWQVMGLDAEAKGEAYDFDRDPEVVFERITAWLVDGEVKTVTAGAERYLTAVLCGIGSPSTIRGLFYQGKRRVVGREARKDGKSRGTSK